MTWTLNVILPTSGVPAVESTAWTVTGSGPHAGVIAVVVITPVEALIAKPTGNDPVVIEYV
jgi:hypothetical protein